ncbi:ferrous iron transport protein B [Catenisphaera adipataccumulans]|uniref:Ferrous iron transport protein B n=1 Tax=Catenisphaera adipataccumulans TaxID=700500 RepID=A0A7W8CYK3_9FIRM|nr:ferrous iron transport protein B [Catenisphaera adipataccumulans]MBB5183766.1 ferrous iron transport protein B [Catenisphaera adipataccumulans]
MKEEMTVAFIGNPNCGKTTLFNAYTGANLKVANWPGVTVERMEGAVQEHNHLIHVVDLPGTYSLSSYTMEEQVSRQFIMSDQVDVIIDVVDASSLERSLYLTLQLLELNKPMVIALNMMDIVRKRGIEIDLHRMSEILGIPVVPVVARKKEGIQTLMHAAVHQHIDTEDPMTAYHHVRLNIHEDTIREHVMEYSDAVEHKIAVVEKRMYQHYPQEKNIRLASILLLQNDSEYCEKYPLDLDDVRDPDDETEIINEKYGFIQELIPEILMGIQKSDELTDRIDNVVTKPFWGVLIFLLIMVCIFALTFIVGDWIQGYVEMLVDALINGVNSWLAGMNVAAWLRNLITQGVIGGVGSILTFLPNIAILFIALAFLEDSGYMARVAYVMNEIMSHLGLSGRAFIPMVLGFGCTVPAIMSSRTLESEKDRRRVMLITPFMSCNAKLPVYILFSGIFFGKNAWLAAYSMYVIGIAVALLTAYLLHRFGDEPDENPLLIELPLYKMPSAYTVYVYVWDKVKDFLSKAGTTIFAASIIIWILMHFGTNGYTVEVTESFAAIIGNALVPILAPCGLGIWQIAVALLAGISAKEVVVSSTAVLFNISNINSAFGMETLRSALAALGFGPLNAYCLMLFCLLYVPCIASMATIRRESGSTAYLVKNMAFQLVLAWALTAIVYQVGIRL